MERCVKQDARMEQPFQMHRSTAEAQGCFEGHVVDAKVFLRWKRCWSAGLVGQLIGSVITVGVPRKFISSTALDWFE